MSRLTSPFAARGSSTWSQIGDLAAGRDESGDVLVRAVPRDAAHRRLDVGVAVARGQGDPEQGRRLACVLEEHFVEVAHPVEENRVRKPALHFEVLPEHRRDAGRGRAQPGASITAVLSATSSRRRGASVERFQMQVLAIDTASPVPSVTLHGPGGDYEEALPDDRRASEELLPAIARCFAAAGTSLADCERIAVCAGPGSFTGLRVGLATAWALGRVSDVPVEAVSTLEAIAETAPPDRREARPRRARRGARRGRALHLRPRGHPGAPGGLAVRLALAEARERAAGLSTAALPPDLLLPGSVRPSELAVAGARARRLPQPGASNRLRASKAIYSRPSAAEEKHGAP